MIHTGKFKRMEIYHNIYGETPEAIKAKTGCTTIVNGMLFNPNGTFCLKARIKGKTVANEDGAFYGYGWSGNNLPIIDHSDNMNNYENYITSIHMVPTIKRGRTAISFYNGKYTVLCVSDSNGAMTISQVETAMKKHNGQFLILDGGGSSYLDCPSGKVDATLQRKTANRMYLLIWEDSNPIEIEGFKIEKEDDTLKVYLSPSSQPANLYSYGNTNEQAQCNRIASYCETALNRCGFDVKKAPEGQSFQKNVSDSNAWGADIHVPIHTNAGGGNGCIVFVQSLSPERLKLANPIYTAINAITPIKNKYGVRANNLYEISHTNAKCVYVECAFHDNKSESEWIIDNATQIGEAICKGVCEGAGVKYIEPTVDNPTASSMFRVQVGAFPTRAAAERLSIELGAKGYKTIITEVKA